MTGGTIITQKAVINSTYTLVKSHEKYLFTPETKSANLPSFIRMAYRRLFRLQPFVSDRKMVRDTYREYLRYKFKKENYEIKRSIVVNEMPKVLLREQLYNSVIFIVKAVSYLPESRQCKMAIARDNTTCRQILKNLLTTEFEKQSLITRYRPPTKHKNTTSPYQILRKDFTHMRDFNKSAQFRVFGEFDICTIFLNEIIHTRL